MNFHTFLVILALFQKDRVEDGEKQEPEGRIEQDHQEPQVEEIELPLEVQDLPNQDVVEPEVKPEEFVPPEEDFEYEDEPEEIEQNEIENEADNFEGVESETWHVVSDESSDSDDKDAPAVNAEEDQRRNLRRVEITTVPPVTEMNSDSHIPPTMEPEVEEEMAPEVEQETKPEVITEHTENNGDQEEGTAEEHQEIIPAPETFENVDELDQGTPEELPDELLQPVPPTTQSPENVPEHAPTPTLDEVDQFAGLGEHDELDNKSADSETFEVESDEEMAGS